MQHVLVVDDKIAPREWAKMALRKIGFPPESIHEAVCGDHAVERYGELSSHDVTVDFVLSDYHMNPHRKPPEGVRRMFRKAVICDGISLARKFQEISPAKPFCLHSGGLTDKVLVDSARAGIELTLYKRRPEDAKFGAYCDVISAYLAGTLTRDLYLAAFPKVNSCQPFEAIQDKLTSTPFVDVDSPAPAR